MNDLSIKASAVTDLIMAEFPMKFLSSFRPKLVVGLQDKVHTIILAHTQLISEKTIDKCASAVTPELIEAEIKKLSFFDRLRLLF